jgi:hypothetical protein
MLCVRIMVRTYTCAYVRTYTCTKVGTRVRTDDTVVCHTMVPMVHVYHGTYSWYYAHVYYEYHIVRTYTSTYCYGTYVRTQNHGTSGTRIRTMVPRTYLRSTNITLSQKQLEIQALRCNRDTSGRCQHRRHHGILQLRFQLDSDVCSADLHHNPR